MTSKYGKSAVDATRRNTLPLFLDDALKTLEEGSGGGGTTLSVTLNKNDWFSLSATEYLLDIPINLDKLDGSLMVFPEGSDSLAYAKADIRCVFDEGLGVLTFVTTKKPTVNLQVIILMIGTNITSAEKVKF